ncbi:S9 family peptidase [Steroidobacter sp.]|uniref:S9 family peptidase n=1 Tax=Steroidobacter sp. TaxID=1978227 RepID=UPI001A585134|nr:prolyl oligopeptidase family serine peptidase [Steroidobacter sp.]MBL8270989.1 S9 family peptidase [Steroidobacter sp.]
MRSKARWVVQWSALAILCCSPWVASALTLQESILAHQTLGLGSSDLIASANGNYVAWMEDSKLLVATPPKFEPRVLITADAQTPLVAAYPSSDGVSLFYVRGRTTPAFASYPAEDSRTLWRVHVTGESSQLLLRGSEVPTEAPIFSPDGKAFVIAEGPMLYEYRLDTEPLRRRPLLQNDPQHYSALRLTNLSYSPDGRQLAFVSWRKAGHSYVGIHTLATGAYQYLEPGIFRDVVPAWSSDSTQLAFVRMPGNWTLEHRFSPQRSAAPWSLMIADVVSGKVRTRWRADEGRGSVFEPYGESFTMIGALEKSQLLWTRTDEILFPWEKTGWLSTYAIDATKGAPRSVASGDGEVSVPVIDASGKNLIHAATWNDHARSHLWRSPISGGKPEQLTRGAGVEHSPRILANGNVAYIGNTHGRMPNRRLVTTNAKQPVVLTPQPEQQHESLWSQLQDTQVVELVAEDGVVSHHLITVPSGPAPAGGFPVIVASKGGPSSRVSPGNGVNTALGQHAVSRGFIFVEINYRGGTGFGLDYRVPLAGGASGASEVLDLRALALYLRSRPDVDATRIGIMGGSYGGHIVGLAMTQLPQYFAAAAHLSGVYDWVLELQLDGEEGGWASAPPDAIRLSERTRLQELAYLSSPPSRISAWRAPTFISMGELDKQGHMQAVIDLGYRLLEQGTPVEFHIAPEAGHLGPRARPPEKVMEFFSRTLGQRH